MSGNNHLTLNKVEMQKAVEYYLNTVVLKTPCMVANIVYDRNSGEVFVISLMPPKEITTGEIRDRVIANDTAIEKGNK
jgi:hypothetical protein